MRGKIPWDIQRPGMYTLREWEIDPANSVLLILDMQRGYADPGRGVGKMLKRAYPKIYGYYYDRLDQVVLPNILKLRDFFRQHRLEVFYTRLGLQLPNGKDLAPWNWRSQLVRHKKQKERSLFEKGSLEYEVIDVLKPFVEELVLDKNSLNPFNSTGLEQFLRSIRLENIVVTGILTNGAVESTARTGGDKGYNVLLVEDACAAYTPEEHEGTIRSPSTTSFVLKSSEQIIRDLSSLLVENKKDRA